MNNISRLNGKRAVPLLRCSTMEQADTSIDDQLDSIKVFAERHGLELAPEIRLAGKSGSIKKNLDQMIDEVIARKKSGERIDAVVYFDQSRFGRSGPMHFGHLADRLSNEGIGLAETDAYIEDRGTADLVRIIKAEAAKRQAMSIAEASARGSQSSLQAGRRSHSFLPAFGIDKLYLNADGTERMIIRRFADGSRVEIDPATGKFGQRYEKGVRGYQKASLEIDTLIPGDPKVRDLIIRIYRMHHDDGLGGSRISRLLNDEGIPSPTGGKWYKHTINGMLRNEVYTGFGYANRISNAIYCNQSPSLPRPIDGDGGKLTRGIRPCEDWHIVEYTKLKEYLPKDLRQKAIRSQAEYRERISAGYIRVPKKANGRLTYLLSGLITEKSTGRPLKAIKSGNSPRTYYGMSGEPETLPTGSPLRRRLPAPPLHRIVLEEIESVICNLPDLEGFIAAAIEQQDLARRGGLEEYDQLIADREKLSRRYKSQLDMLGDVDDDAVRQSIYKSTKQIQKIDDRIAAINAGPTLTAKQICKITKGIIADLSLLLDKLSSEGDKALRCVTETMIGSAIADLEAGEVEFEFVVSSEIIEKRIMGLAECRGPTTIRQTHKWKPIVLDGIIVELPERCSKDCWNPFKPRGCPNCKRNRKAA